MRYRDAMYYFTGTRLLMRYRGAGATAMLDILYWYSRERHLRCEQPPKLFTALPRQVTLLDEQLM